MVAATAELLHLAPGGSGAAAMDAFLTKFRSLLAVAGKENVGPAAQADVLMRAATGHPVLGPVMAAWKQAGCQDSAVLLEKMEDAVAEGRCAPSGGRGVARAWAAMEEPSSSSAWGDQVLCAGPATYPIGAQQPQWGPREWGEWAAVAAAQRQTAVDAPKGPLCWTCNQRGHRMRQCPHGRLQPSAGARTVGSSGGNDAIMAKLTELIDLMKQSKK